ncbi:MAG: SRPBCC family protein [Alphaproteobacteria bacterium]|nr:SRPBCC family protein [Alphaproteobacteria bacterium]
MWKALAIGAVIVLVVVAGILVYAATKPDSFRVQRSVAIKASPDKIFALLDDFKAWASWSPYEKKDPAMKRTFGAITAGKGATYAWQGDKSVGAGSMEILEASPRKVLIKLDFSQPFEAHNTAEFTLDPKGDTTTVTWAIYGPNPFMAKVMQTFMNIDKMIGQDFEKGLADLKAAAEK